MVPTAFSPTEIEESWVFLTRQDLLFYAAARGTASTVKRVKDPTTESVRTVRICVRLGLKSQMTKLGAREALRAEIARRTNQLADGRVLKDGSVTFEWFVRNRYLLFEKETGGRKRRRRKQRRSRST